MSDVVAPFTSSLTMWSWLTTHLCGTGFPPVQSGTLVDLDGSILRQGHDWGARAPVIPRLRSDLTTIKTLYLSLGAYLSGRALPRDPGLKSLALQRMKEGHQSSTVISQGLARFPH